MTHTIKKFSFSIIAGLLFALAAKFTPPLIAQTATSPTSCPTGWYWDAAIGACWNSAWDSQWEPVPGTNEWINRTDGSNSFTVSMPSESGQTCSVRNRPCAAPNQCQDTATFNSSIDLHPNGPKWEEENCDIYNLQNQLETMSTGYTRCVPTGNVHTNPIGKEGECQTFLYQCNRRKTCAEIANTAGTNFNVEFGTPDGLPEADEVLTWDADPGNAGSVKNLRCGRIDKTSPPFWQVAGGNIYAQASIRRNSEVEGDKYVIRSDSFSCATGASPTAGLQLVNSNNISDLAGSPTYPAHASQRTLSDTAAYPAFDATRVSTIQNFAYFQSMVDYTGLATCPSFTIVGEGAQATQVCRTTTTTASHLNLSSMTGIKRVIFVDGDLTLDINVTTPLNQFLAFIVSGKVTVSADLGDAYNNTMSCFDDPEPCRTNDDAHVQAVVIANEIEVKGYDRTVDDDIFNRDAFCDRRLTLAGTYVAWSSDIKFGRTFKGCGLAPGAAAYPDCNRQHPVITVLYRPDFLTSIPEWMKRPLTVRQEVI